MPVEVDTFSFGEYTLNVPLRQLRRAGEIVPLPGKAFDLLAFMASNPGRPLTKSELLAAVWPDSFVEEANLSQNVFLLRKALGRDASAPIVTLPGRGYQFAATVRPITAQQPVSAAIRPVTVAALMEEEASSPAPTDEAVDVQRTEETLEGTAAAQHMHIDMVRSRLVVEEVEEHIAFWRSPIAVALLGLGLVVSAAAAWLGWERYEDRVGGPPVQVVLAGFEGGTGDKALDKTLESALRIDLAQSPFVTLVSGSSVRQTLQQMMRSSDELLTPQLARDVCERTGSQAVLHGTVAQTGSRFLLTGEANSCVDGSTVATAQEEANGREDLPKAIDRMAASLRHGLGESRRTIARFNQPLVSAKTGSIEALEAYSQGTSRGQHGQILEAIDLLKQAIAIDPHFATAYFDLSNYYGNLSDGAHVREYLQKAYDNRDNATAASRLTIEARYAGIVDGDLFQEERAYRAMLALYPRSAVALAALGETERQLGRHAEAVDALTRALALAPNYAILYYGLCAEKMHTGDLEGALSACQAGIQRGLDNEATRVTLLKIAYLKHDAALEQQQLDWASAHPSPMMLAAESDVRLSEGRVHEALTLIDQSCNLLTQRHLDSVCNMYRLSTAAELATLEDPGAAKTLAAGVPVDPSDLNELLAVAATGDPSRAATDLARVEATMPPSAAFHSAEAPLVKAEIELAQHHPADVAATLEPTRPYEGTGLDSMHERARGYLESHQPALAETEFRRVLARPQLDPLSVELPMARLGLARALAAEGRTAEAREAYAQLLSVWAHADDDLPSLRAARREAGALGSG